MTLQPLKFFWLPKHYTKEILDKAVKAIRAEIRSWDLPERSDKQIEDLVSDVQPGDSGLASILRTVLSFGTLPVNAATRSLIGSMGLSKVQKVAWSSSKGDLLVILDDATSEIYYAQLVEEESTRTVMTALREVVELVRLAEERGARRKATE
jgi:hypothetical protein